MTRSILISIIILVSLSLFAQERIDLSGTWRFAIDRHDVGHSQGWHRQTLSDRIQLPGSMPENLKGDDITLTTNWEGSIFDSSFYFAPRLAKFREPGNLKIPFWLTPDKHYIGWAWYQRDVDIPASWNGKRMVLHLERPHFETVVWVNNNKAGEFLSHCVPHEYDVTQWLRAGRNTITIAVDNTQKELNVGENSHSISDHTQGNWNGIVGNIHISAGARIWFDDIQVYPDLTAKKARVKMTVNSSLRGAQRGNITLSAASFNSDRQHIVPEITVPFTVNRTAVVEVDLPMGDDMQTWDEFNPALYRLKAQLTSDREADRREVQFGMREIIIDGRWFYVNGRQTILRGTTECCLFPHTGYAPMDVEAWERVYRICKAFGLNHVRFHSHCPPEAAFIAADLVGIYLQPEGPSWPNYTTTLGSGLPIDDYLMLETQRLSKWYGNYASFVMLASSNEPRGPGWVAWSSNFVKYWKATDSRRVYTGASVGGSWAWQPDNQFHVKAGVRGLAWGARPESVSDFRALLDTVRQPYVSFEIGQWCVFPNFEEIKKYTGVNQALNFELFREDLADSDMALLAHDFLMASGKLQALCYKHEIEKHFRTPDYAGFQLLSLNDFSGQGSALVGVLDVFWDEKGYINEEQWRRFCSQTVPLMRTAKFTYRNNETLTAEVEVAHFGAEPLRAAHFKWTLKDNWGKEYAKGEFAPKDAPIGSCFKIGDINVPLSMIDKAMKLNLEISIAGTNHINDWDFFVYPVQEKPQLSGIHETDTLDNVALEILRNGGNVLLLTAGKIEYGKDIVQHMAPVFWNTSWFRMRPPHTTGILVNPYHPVFADFPTDYHSNLQWWELVHRAQVMQLTDFPKGFQPLIQSIDTWFINRKIGMLFEANVLNGKLMACSADLKSDWENRPVAQQLYTSIVNYMQSNKFRPSYQVDVQNIQDLYRKEGERIMSYTVNAPEDM